MLNLELKTNKKVDSLPNFHKIGICFVNFLPDEFSQCFICSTSLSLDSDLVFYIGYEVGRNTLSVPIVLQSSTLTLEVYLID